MKKSTKLALAITAIVIGCQPLPWHTPDVFAATQDAKKTTGVIDTAVSPQQAAANQAKAVATVSQMNAPIPTPSQAPGTIKWNDLLKTSTFPAGLEYTVKNPTKRWRNAFLWEYIRTSQKEIYISSRPFIVTGSVPQRSHSESWNFNLDTGIITWKAKDVVNGVSKEMLVGNYNINQLPVSRDDPSHPSHPFNAMVYALKEAIAETSNSTDVNIQALNKKLTSAWTTMTAFYAEAKRISIPPVPAGTVTPGADPNRPSIKTKTVMRYCGEPGQEKPC